MIDLSPVGPPGAETRPPSVSRRAWLKAGGSVATAVALLGAEAVQIRPVHASTQGRPFMPNAFADGIELYYEVHGTGTAVVFLHGAGGNHLSWWQQVPFFQQDYRCITFDHRGFGQSHAGPGPLGPPAFLADLTMLLDHLEIAECFLVAQSLGGYAAFGLALEEPQRVKALVMADTILGIPSNAIRARFRTLWDAGLAVTGEIHAASFPEHDPARAFLLTEQIPALNPPFPAAAREQGRHQLSVPIVEPDFSRFAVPTLFLFGAEDTDQPPELGRLAHGLVPHSRYVEIEGAGHCAYFERPTEFNRIVSEFFAEVSAAPGV
jgi:3-oxoadipate enol-lactonase